MSYYIGFIQDKRTKEIKAVSISNLSKQQAGDLAQQYVDNYDPDQLDIKVWGGFNQ